MLGTHRTIAALTLALLPALALALAVVAAPSTAGASNLVHPRTPVLWPEAPCIATADRSVSTSFAFTYEIPSEDTQLTADELDDSRRHQFLAFCRQWPAGRPPPRYITLADLQRAVDSGNEQAEALDDVESTLETSAIWAGCWTRITADDARRPITFTSAAEPVLWDLTGVEPGTWLIAGFTWEPPYSLWSRAPWVLRVLDEPDPAERQAAATIADTPDTVAHDAMLELPMCVDAIAGSTVTLEWAPTKPEQLVWSAVDSVEIDGPTTALIVPFVPPPESFGLTVALRAVVEQPLGTGYQAHALAPVIVFAAPATGDGDGDGDGDTSGSEGDSTETSGTGDTGPAAGEGGGQGHCSLAPTRGNLPTLVGALALLLLGDGRRRRRARPHPSKLP